MERLGVDNVRQEGEHGFHVTDANGFSVQISGLDVTVLSD
jgi:hypothetical protein